jgi:radical SAM protein with 4Fe4S-binding SPASM domain
MLLILHEKALSPFFPQKNAEPINHNFITETSRENNSYKRRPPCPGLWLYIGIHPDGTISPCCQDPDGEFKIGNINHKSLKDIWLDNQILTKYRLWHITGEFYKIPLCKNCTNKIDAFISKEELTEYLISVGKEKLISHLETF